MNSIYEQVTNAIINQLEQGIVPWCKPWVCNGQILSYATGKQYSLLNRMLLAEPGEYASFLEVQKAGGRIRKGAKASRIYFCKPLVKEFEVEKEGVITKEEKITFIFKAYSYSSDKRSHYDCVMISRGGIKKYLYAKAFCCMIGGFIITFTPMLVNMIVNYVFLPYTSNDSSYNSIPEEILRFVDKGFYKTKSNDAYLWLISPKSSILFSTLRMGILGATVSLVIYVISMFINNLRFKFFIVFFFIYKSN